VVVVWRHRIFMQLTKAKLASPWPGRRILKAMNSYRAFPRRPLPGSPFAKNAVPPSEAEQYSVNDKVTHDKYGLGTIIGVEEGVGVVVDFRSHKQHLRTPCSKLAKL
jgi:hypothetical protein